MNIGIIGAGFSGLSAANELQKKGHKVTILEKESVPGGLANGFKMPKWNWTIENHYHHIFSSDIAIINLAKEVGIEFDFSHPNTSWLIQDKIHRVDSALKVLTFQQLKIIDRLRMASVLAYFKLTSNWKKLEKYTAHEWLPQKMGKVAFEMFWKPLLESKFHKYSRDISLAWFWARIKSRTAMLGYPNGGFQNLINKVVEMILNNGGSIKYNEAVKSIIKKENGIEVQTNNQKYIFDKVIVTLPNYNFAQIAPQLPLDYVDKLKSSSGIGAINMILELDEPFFKSDIYWLSVCDKKYPFIAVVEHTNFVNINNYNNHHLVYIGNYLPADHEYFNLSKSELLKIYKPYLEKLSPEFKKHLVDYNAFKAPFAQPIVTINYSNKILPSLTPIEGVYLINMQQVYPWDRQTNYAVEMGKKVIDQYFN